MNLLRMHKGDTMSECKTCGGTEKVIVFTGDTNPICLKCLKQALDYMEDKKYIFNWYNFDIVLRYMNE